MILREVICNEIIDYFSSDDWQEVIRQMSRGPEVRHAHVYADSILHPEPLLKIVEAWFEAQGMSLQRQIYLLHMPGVPGLADIYNIHTGSVLAKLTRSDSVAPGFQSNSPHF